MKENSINEHIVHVEAPKEQGNEVGKLFYYQIQAMKRIPQKLNFGRLIKYEGNNLITQG